MNIIILVLVLSRLAKNEIWSYLRRRNWSWSAWLVPQTDQSPILTFLAFVNKREGARKRGGSSIRFKKKNRIFFLSNSFNIAKGGFFAYCREKRNNWKLTNNKVGICKTFVLWGVCARVAHKEMTRWRSRAAKKEGKEKKKSKPRRALKSESAGSVLNISGGAEGRSLPPSVSRSVCRPSTCWCFVATFYPRWNILTWFYRNSCCLEIYACATTQVQTPATTTNTTFPHIQHKPRLPHPTLQAVMPYLHINFSVKP